MVVDDRLQQADVPAILGAGADDCYQKPFLPPIFAARVRGLLRRPPGPERTAAPAAQLEFGGGLVIRPDDRRVLVDGLPAPLNRMQFDLLACLVRNKNSAVPAKTLIPVLQRTLLYVAPERLALEATGLRARIGRFASAVVSNDDGSIEMRESQEPPARACP